MKLLKLHMSGATGLKEAHQMSTMKPFIAAYVVGLVPDGRVETPPDLGCSPEWNFPLKFDQLPEPDLQQNSFTLVFEILSNNKLGKSREIGKVVVPVKDLLDSSMTGNNNKTLQVITPSGGFQGELTFSYEFSDTSEPTREDMGTHAPSTSEQTDGVLSGLCARICCGVAADIVAEVVADVICQGILG